MTTHRQTRFSDVCGTIDDLKRILHEESSERLPSETLTSYVEDCLSMLERMELRLTEFAGFRNAVTTILEQMQQIEESLQTSALTAAQELFIRFEAITTPSHEEIDQLCALAETVRDAANLAESRLRRFKQAALELGKLYGTVEGGRGWQKEGQDAVDAGMEVQLAAWLPRSPHREKILAWLKVDRARLVMEDGQPPVVAFEDGGMIPLRDVRWSDEVDNFVPASFKPHPHGPKYRPAG